MFKKIVILSLVILLVAFQPDVPHIRSDNVAKKVKERLDGEKPDQDILKNIFPLEDLDETETLKGPFPFAGFKENRGQLANEDILYYYEGPDLWIGLGAKQVHYSLFLQETGERLSFSISFAGARVVNPDGIKQLPHYSHYFKEKWTITDIRSFGEIYYRNLYPNIDLRFYQSSKGLKYDFLVYPGGKIEDITLEANPETQLDICPDEVIVRTSAAKAGKITYDSQLDVFYEEGGEKLDAEFIPKLTNSYGFSVKQEKRTNDSDKTIIVDPLLFSTYLGGSDNDHSLSLAVDAVGNCYITGYTYSSDFPTVNAYDNSFGGGGVTDAFVSKLSADGSSLLFSTYLGGGSEDRGNSIAVDGAGNCYITGYTYSSDFPTVNAYDNSFGG
ncbi:MAG: SBBP repeat-containing protein, partial [Candidatus Odinarchaeota archaeon]